MQDRNYGLLDVFLVGAVLILSVGIISPKVRHWITNNRNDGGTIATATIVDAKTGKMRKYEINRFLENRKNYCRFETADGKTVEVLESEVREE